jgi:hypothetical protein
MNFSKCLTVIGALFLVCGLLTAFISSRYTERVVSEEQRGAAVRPPEADSTDRDQRKSVHSWADFTFYTGLVLAVTGGVILAVFLPFLGPLPANLREAVGRRIPRRRGRSETGDK